ncbi:MAG: threonine--tRNA ligase [Acidobacteria bacterium]|nr:threonine--tRNA ligase [Acidobacteriota bacterium]
MSTVSISLPDGSTREFPKPVTPLEIAQSIGPGLARDALAARVDGELRDLASPIEKDSPVQIITPKSPEGLEIYRHSSAHLMAAAVKELFPDARPGVGPATETGFFYDFRREKPFTEADLEKIEQKMKELVAADIPYERIHYPKEEGRKLFEQMGEMLKCELISEKAEAVFSAYKTGNFLDFCLGPHIPSTGRIRAFKLLSVAGAYWKGDETSYPMQRIYGTSFFNQKGLDDFLHKIEEAKRRDHRRLGKELDLFSIQEDAGPGLIFWHPKGATIRKEVQDYLERELVDTGYQLVSTPHLARLDLWKTSGHTNFYSENMFTPMELDDATYQLKPMNCPFHVLIYRNTRRSYRELPMRLAEFGTVYRYERSGVMHGLLRVRGFTQDDAHIFATPETIEEEIGACVDIALKILRTFGFEKYEVELSLRDPNSPDETTGEPADWQFAEDTLRKVLKSRKITYKSLEGEAAFYGPKIDIKVVDALGRPWQLSTIQYDFNLPMRFGLEYIGADGRAHRPLMVHRALLGSVERFLGVLIEHYGGNFPVWLAPVQVAVLPVSEKQASYAQQVADRLRQSRFRVHLDERNEKLNARIRDAQLSKIPFTLVVGGREEEGQSVAVRRRGQREVSSQSVEDFVQSLEQLRESRAVG